MMGCLPFPAENLSVMLWLLFGEFVITFCSLEQEIANKQMLPHHNFPFPLVTSVLIFVRSCNLICVIHNEEEEEEM